MGWMQSSGRRRRQIGELGGGATGPAVGDGPTAKTPPLLPPRQARVLGRQTPDATRCSPTAILSLSSRHAPADAPRARGSVRHASPSVLSSRAPPRIPCTVPAILLSRSYHPNA